MTSDSNFITRYTAPDEIWKMPQLRHLILGYYLSLPNPPASQMDDIVMENLQTLSRVLNFRCTEKVVRKILNLVKLKLVYDDEHDKGLPPYSLTNVRHLKKLQSLHCEFQQSGYFMSRRHNYLRHIMGFPNSLRKLTLHGTGLNWKDVTTKIGSLLHLEKLKLEDCSSGYEWNPVEGHFLNLKYLEISTNDDLVHWAAESVHFPHLEHLVIFSVQKLNVIPCGIEDMATLQSIRLYYCSNSAIYSAKEILKEQQSFGNYGLSLVVDRKPVIMESGDQNESSE